ncbi:uncharacterized protein LOC114972737 [Acropora millepora]|uniref:uncharacterized protein LOC114972737 n=1 Tax=Acropora millepora TaxID=45264 RepID=UPI001CF282AB|nr:uncharacterized protein LOC114972737 [Acropora millepora]
MAFRNLTKVPKLCLLYFSIDKTTCIVETKKIRRKESGEAFSNTGPESGAKVILKANGKLLDTMVIALHDDENQLNQEERSFVEDPVNAHLFAEEDTIMDKREQPRNADLTAKRTRTTDNQDEVQMLQNLIAEQETKQAHLKQQRTPKISHRDASIQCARTEAATPRLRQTSDVAVQTEFVDVMADLKEQVKNLTQIVAELTALKSHNHQEPRTIDRPLLAELLSDDTMSDIAEYCPDSSENYGAESPLPGLQHHSVVERPSPQTHQILVANGSPVTYSSRPPLAAIQQNRQTNTSLHGPTDEQRRQVEVILLMGKEMSTTALACVDVLYTENELANGNTGGTFGYAKLDEHKLSFLCSRLRQKFDSPSFAGQWDNVRTKINNNSKCRGKRRTVVKRLKQNASH